MLKQLDLVRRVVRMGTPVSMKVIGHVAAPVPPAKRGRRPHHRDELVAAAKALALVGLPSRRIAKLLRIPDSHEAVKWWVRGLSRKHVGACDALYETIMKAIEQSVAGE